MDFWILCNGGNYSPLRNEKIFQQNYLDLLTNEKPDERQIMTYVSCYYHAFQGAMQVILSSHWSIRLTILSCDWSMALKLMCNYDPWTWCWDNIWVPGVNVVCYFIWIDVFYLKRMNYPPPASSIPFLFNSISSALWAGDGCQDKLTFVAEIKSNFISLYQSNHWNFFPFFSARVYILFVIYFR